MEMPRACTEVIETQNEKGWIDSSIKNCPLYNVCEQRETIKTNYKPMDCPLIEIGICKKCRHWNKSEEHCSRLSNDNGWFEDEYYRVYTESDFYCKYFEKRNGENG